MKPAQMVTIVVGFACIIGVFIFLRVKQNSGPNNASYQVGSFTIKEDKSDVGIPLLGQKKCHYSTIFQNKTIDLGEYVENGTCGEVDQKPVLANGMLAIIAGRVVFFYDQKKDIVMKLDPEEIKTFQEFAKTKNINVANYPNRRFFINGDQLQVLYTSDPDSKKQISPASLTFISQNAEKSFVFNHTQQ